MPWTAQLLAFASGYGAGVSSPGWYDHLFTAPDRVSERWLTRTVGDVELVHSSSPCQDLSVAGKRVGDHRSIARLNHIRGMLEARGAARC